MHNLFKERANCKQNPCFGSHNRCLILLGKGKLCKTLTKGTSFMTSGFYTHLFDMGSPCFCVCLLHIRPCSFLSLAGDCLGLFGRLWVDNLHGTKVVHELRWLSFVSSVLNIACLRQMTTLHLFEHDHLRFLLERARLVLEVW